MELLNVVLFPTLKCIHILRVSSTRKMLLFVILLSFFHYIFSPFLPARFFYEKGFPILPLTISPPQLKNWKISMICFSCRQIIYEVCSLSNCCMHAATHVYTHVKEPWCAYLRIWISHRYVQQIVAPGWGKINQRKEEEVGKSFRGKNKYESVEF